MVCTIHQPSSDICSLFDDAMLLSGVRQTVHTLQAHHLHTSIGTASVSGAHQDAGKGFVLDLKGLLAVRRWPDAVQRHLGGGRDIHGSRWLWVRLPHIL